MFERIFWYVLPLVLLLTACSGATVAPTRSPGGSPVPEACDLLSEADFRALSTTLGPLSRTEEGSDDGLFSSCSWQSADASQFISLSLWRGESSTGVADQFLALQRDGLGRQRAIDSFGTDTILAGTEFAWSLGWHSGDELAVLITTVGAGFDEDGVISLGELVEQELN